MEPMRGVRPKKGFLREIRKIASKNKIVLIFDEITSGFHDTYGGIHLDFKVNPDIVIYGKSLGNGYPISAIVGKKKLWTCLKIHLLAQQCGLTKLVL